MALSLPAVSLLPSLSGLLGAMLQATGLSSIQDFYGRVQTMIKDADVLDAGQVHALIQDLDQFLAGLGTLMPSGGFAKIKVEIDKYGAIIQGIASGQPQTIEEITATLPNGEKVDLLVILQVKPVTA